VGGKLYAIGEPFPADKVDPKKLAGFKKAGCIGSVPFPVADAEPNDGRDKDFALLQGRLSSLEADKVEAGDKIAGLQLELEALADIDMEKVGELEAQAKELKAEIKKLKKAAKEAVK